MKVKKTSFLAASCVVASLLASCATDSDYVDAKDTSIAVKNKDTISQSDWVIITQEMGEDLLKAPLFQEYLEAYKIDAEERIREQEAKGEKFTTRAMLNAKKPLLMLSTIKNNTSEHIDSVLLTEKLRETLFNSGMVRFTTYAAGEGQVVDAATAQARDLQSDPNVKKGAVTKRNKVSAYDLSLSGVITKQTAVSGRSNEISYTFSLTLTDNETGEGVWTATKEVKRQHKQGGIGW